MSLWTPWRKSRQTEKTFSEERCGISADDYELGRLDGLLDAIEIIRSLADGVADRIDKSGGEQ